MSRRISDADRRVRLVVRHGLAPPASGGTARMLSPLEVTRSVVALHSSDPASVYLSVLVRSPSTTIESVSDAMYVDRVLARIHGMRHTLWVADVETAADIVTASSSRLVRAQRRNLARGLAAAGVEDPEGWIDDARAEILAFVADAGLVDTRTIGEALPHRAIGFGYGRGTEYAGTIAAHTRILHLLGCEGSLVRAAPRGTWIASHYRWAEPTSWLGRPLVAGGDGIGAGEPDPTDVAAAQAAVIDRYLRVFGPVTTEDLVWWTGWPKGALSKALTSLGAREVDLSDGSGWLAASDDFEVTPRRREEAARSVALLPALDPATMGWKRRDHYLDPDMVGHLFDRNGNGGPTVWVGGHIVGGWAQRDDGDMAYRLLADVGSEARRLIEEKLNRLATSIGDARYKVRAPNPLDTALRS